MRGIRLEQVKLLTALFGFLYFIYGTTEALSFFGREITLVVPPTGDLFVGFVLLTISAVYFTGLKKSLEGSIRGTSYLYVGALLGMGFAVLALLVMGADAIEACLLHSEDFIGWSPLDDITSYLILGLLSIIAYLPVKDVSKEPLKVNT